jgi:hypothetical protein
VLRYIVTIPIDDASNTEVYMIEEYASKEAHALHLQAPPVQELVSLFSSGDVLASGPEVHNDGILAQKVFHGVMPPDPAIVLRYMEYKPEELSGALHGWKNTLDSAEKHDSIVAYAVLGKEEECGRRTVEIYESEDYMEKAKGNEDRGGVQVRLRFWDGYLGNNRGYSKM